MTVPFRYPEHASQRRHGPRGYADPESFRPWLRDGVYCLGREQWGRVRGTFDTEHFLAVSRYPESRLEYANLLYSCASCNSAKGDRDIPDPRRALLREDVHIYEDGGIEGRTRAARRLIEVLGLAEPEVVEFRSLWINIIAVTSRYEPDLWERLLRYPDNLPDLARLQPPGGNDRPEGIEASAYRRRERGELPATY